MEGARPEQQAGRDVQLGGAERRVARFCFARGSAGVALGVEGFRVSTGISSPQSWEEERLAPSTPRQGGGCGIFAVQGQIGVSLRGHLQTVAG